MRRLCSKSNGNFLIDCKRDDLGIMIRRVVSVYSGTTTATVTSLSSAALQMYM